jgi:UDP-N-acetylglucosamine--N-acetylmuramyl-(pentapeptide) pyrophosphoryl-undecaprenol N-acetylglucosamine transferase
MPFCNHMAELLSAADVTVARSGAGSLAELARVGLPSILIPFPHAADDHQMANALYYERAGAASVLPQKRIKELWGLVQSLLFDEAALAQMKASLKALDTENAQAIFADELCALVKEGDC